MIDSNLPSRARTILALSSVLLGVAIAPVFTYAVPVVAQSAADKATARQLATEGIRLYRDQQYEDSLDRMQRAQELYKAPVHLLYIARAQAKLGQLVEAAETYRQLQRVKLDDSASEAFKKAVDAATRELEELKPRIPKLRIVVASEAAEELELSIDERPLSTAVIGVERLANPGEHHVSAIAKGYEPATATVTLGEGETETVELVLEPSASAADSTTSGSADSAAASRSDAGFFLGLRLGVSVPFGTLSSRDALTQGASDEDVLASDIFGAGGGIELRGGLRLWQHYHAVLFFEAHALSAGSRLQDGFGYRPQDNVTNSPSAQAAGLGFMYKSAEPGKFGFFGEVDLAFLHTFKLSQDVELGDPIQNETCATHENTLQYSGAGLRLGGGLNIPLDPLLDLSPFAMLTVSQFSSLEAKTSCDADLQVRRFAVIPPGESSIDKELQEGRAHGLLYFGVGGSFLFGGDI